MYLLSVIPISTSAHTDVLDYFSKDPVDPGMIVQISVRKKIMNGLVLSSVPATHAKHAIKNSSFAFKKIITVVGPSPISSKLVSSIQQLAKYVVTAPGVIIANSVPSWLFSTSLKFDHAEKNRNTNGVVSVFQAPIRDRVTYYQQLVDDGKRVLIICPTEQQQKQCVENIAGSVLIPPKPSAKKLSAIFEALSRLQSGIIVALPLGIGLIDVLAPDIVVIEHEADNRYVRQKTPHLDMRMIIEQLARDTGSDCIIADTLVRSYTHARVASNMVTYIQQPVWPTLRNVCVVSHAKNEDAITVQRDQFFSETLLQQLQHQSPHEKIVVYVPRKGLAPMVVCQDCGTAVVCDQCGLLRKLVEKRDQHGDLQRMYACAHPQHTVLAYDVCAQCGGHRLQGLGVSTLGIRDHIHALFPAKELFVLDQDSADSEKKQRHVMQQFQSAHNALLIATSLVIPLLDASVTKILIPSLDMLVSHPSPEARESIMHTLVQCIAATPATIVLQTRLPENTLFDSISNDSLSAWFEHEQVLRKTYNVPPYSIWLSVHARLQLSEITTFKKILGTIPLRAHTVTVAQAASAKQLHGVATYKVSYQMWNNQYQDPELEKALSRLPFGYHIELSTRLSQ